MIGEDRVEWNIHITIAGDVQVTKDISDRCQIMLCHSWLSDGVKLCLIYDKPIITLALCHRVVLYCIHIIYICICTGYT